MNKLLPLFAFLSMILTHAQEKKTLYKIIESVSSERIEKDIQTLVNFGTRHTLSDTLSKSRGIGAARRWIKSEFDKISAACSNCLDVSMQRTLEKGNVTQFGVNSSIGTTGHKLQGSTKKNLIVVSWNYKFKNWPYVVLSRVETSSGLYLLEKLDPNKDYSVDPRLLREEERLKVIERRTLELRRTAVGGEATSTDQDGRSS